MEDLRQLENQKQDPDPFSRFRKKYYPNTTDKQWNSWKWQKQNSIDTLEKIEKIIDLKEEEEIFFKNKNKFPFLLTPYYASIIENSTLRKSVIPSIYEFEKHSCEMTDPLNEDHQSPISNLVHRYPNRVLLLTTNECYANCRFCTRSRMVGKDLKERFNKEHYKEAIEYIKKHKEITDVICSGGDPLTLEDETLDWLLNEIRNIKHVEIIRIGTKAPVVMPQRITKKLVNILKKYHPLYMSIHFTHPDELSKETSEACNMLANAGIVLKSQTVLLKDINDSSDILSKLFMGLLKIRVTPYILYNCDLVKGTNHFRTKIEDGLKIMRGLQGYISGYAVPKFIIDSAGGMGKIPIYPDNYKYVDGGLELKNYKNKVIFYPEE